MLIVIYTIHTVMLLSTFARLFNINITALSVHYSGLILRTNLCQLSYDLSFLWLSVCLSFICLYLYYLHLFRVYLCMCVWCMLCHLSYSYICIHEFVRTIYMLFWLDKICIRVNYTLSWLDNSKGGL